MKDFTVLPNRLISEADSSAVIAVYAAIAWHKSQKRKITDHVFPGMNTISEIAKVSKPTAIAAVKWLKGKGFLIVNSRPGHAQGFSYTFPGLDGQTGKKEEPVKQETGQSETLLFAETGKNETPEPVKIKHPKKNKEKNKKINTLHEQKELTEKDPRFQTALAFLLNNYAIRNDGLKLSPSGRLLGSLKRLLASLPNWTAEDFETAIRNRFDSEGVSPSELPDAWINTLPSYRAGPLNRFRQLMRKPSTPFTEIDYRLSAGLDSNSNVGRI